MSILLFFFVLFVLILVHEWGHFIVAKKTGMRVDEFGIGFPPKLFGKKWHGTEYTFNALPIGGFVRIKGENPEDAIESDSFSAKSKWAQTAVLIAGVTMNVLFAWLLFSVVFMIGLPTAIEEKDASEHTALLVTHVLPGGPADNASLPIGAQITSFGVPNTESGELTPSAFRTFTQTHGTNQLEITYVLKDAETTIYVDPVVGLIAEDRELPAVGIALSFVEVVGVSPYQAVVKAAQTTIHSIGAITEGIVMLAVESIKGTADFSEVSGPIGIVSLVGDAAEFGMTSLLMFTAIISLNLAVINMLPFPALDGGRLVMVGIEALTGKPLNPKWVARVNLVGFILLLLLMVAVTYNDILKMF